MPKKKTEIEKKRDAEKRMAEKQLNEDGFNKAAIRSGASISYITLPGDKVMITEIEGFSRGSEIINIYGGCVAKAYGNSLIRMYASLSGEGDNGLIVYSPDFFSISIHTILTNEEYGKLTAIVKACGKRLHDIIEAVKQEPKRVKI